MRREGKDNKNPDTKPRITLDDLYKLAIKKLRNRVNPQPPTLVKIRELLKILACEDKPLRYSHLLNQMKESPNLSKKNKAGMEGFLKRYLRFLSLDKIIEKTVITENNVSKEAYQLAYDVEPKPLSPSVKEKIRKCEDAWDYVRYEKKDIFYLHENLLQLKSFYDVTGNNFLPWLLQFVVLQLRINIEGLKLLVEKENLRILSRTCRDLEELRKTYLKIFRTKSKIFDIETLHKKLDEDLDEIKFMPLKYPPDKSERYGGGV